MNQEESKRQFEAVYRETIRRQGAEQLLAWLENTDFFTAPASARYHLAEAGGLCQHSLHVYGCLVKLVKDWQGMGYAAIDAITEESIAICGLLHDLCKVNFYQVEMRNRKNPTTGAWESVPYYTIDDQLNFGHGSGSYYVISKFMRLTVPEAMGIRWHMGAFQEGEARDAGAAFEKYPLALLTHIADMMAADLLESESNAADNR